MPSSDSMATYAEMPHSQRMPERLHGPSGPWIKGEKTWKDFVLKWVTHLCGHFFIVKMMIHPCFFSMFRHRSSSEQQTCFLDFWKQVEQALRQAGGFNVAAVAGCKIWRMWSHVKLSDLSIFCSKFASAHEGLQPTRRLHLWARRAASPTWISERSGVSES